MEPERRPETLETPWMLLGDQVGIASGSSWELSGSPRATLRNAFGVLRSSVGGFGEHFGCIFASKAISALFFLLFRAFSLLACLCGAVPDVAAQVLDHTSILLFSPPSGEVLSNRTLTFK